MPSLSTGAGRSILVVGAQYPPHCLGGYELLCRDHVGHLRADGHQVTVLTSTWDAPPHRGDEVGEHGERVVRALDFRWRDFVILRPRGPALWRSERRQRRSVDRTVAACRPDVAVVWHMAAISKAVLARLHRHGVPQVLVIGEPWPAWDVGDDPWTRRWSRSAVRPIARAVKPLASRVLSAIVTDTDLRPALGACVPVYASEHLRTAVEGSRPEWRGRGYVVRNGIDGGLFTRDRAAGDPLGSPLRLLVAGRIERRKGVHTAVEAVAKLGAAGIDATLEIAGWQDPVYAAELHRLAERLGVSGAVRLSGPRERSELPDVYRSVDVLLFPTIWPEPFGLVPLEAMAAGCLVVATGTGGSGEVLQDGDNALLFPVEDAGAAADRIARLVDDSELVARLRRGGRATVAQYGFDAYARGLDTVIDEAIGGRTVASSAGADERMGAMASDRSAP